MTELATRTITGTVYVGLTLAAAWIGPVTTALLFLPVCGMAAWEMHRLFGKTGIPSDGTWAVMAALFVYVAMALAGILPRVSPLFALATILAVVVLGVVILLWLPDRTAMHEMGSLLTVIFLVAVPFGLIPALMRHGHEVFIGFMLLLWTNDTGAYLVGRSIGRTPLLKRVSPKKTVEGLAGGILLALAVGWGLARVWTTLDTSTWIIAAAVVAVTSTLGDLLESAFKREAGVKDSGAVLPGHGGMLDRFDGFLLAMPAMLVTVEALQ